MNSTRTAIVAVILSAIPGLGHLFLGRPRRAMSVVVLALLSGLWALALFMLLAGSAMALIVPVTMLLAVAAVVIFDAYRLAHQPQTLPVGPELRVLIYAGWILAFATVAEWEVDLVQAQLWQAFRVPTTSMEPTLLHGDWFAVDKRAYRETPPNRGDVVVVQDETDPEHYLVKRIVAVGGDHVAIEHGRILVNGRSDRHDRTPPEEITLAEGELFLAGDNRLQSADSRHWGPVRLERVVGRVSHLAFSVDPEENAVRWGRVGRRVE